MRLTDKVLRAMRWDTAGSLAISAITFLTTVWLVRLLGPDGYGALAALLAALALGQLLASGGLRFTVLRFTAELQREQGRAAVTRLLARAALGRTIVFVAVSLPLWLAPAFVASLGLGRPELARYVRLLPLLLGPPLYADILAAGLVALFRQPSVRLGEVANKLIFAASLLLVPLWQDPLHGVFFAWIVGWLVGIGWMAVDAARQDLLQWPKEQTLKTGRWLRFSGAAYALSLIGFVLGRELDILLLTRLGASNETLAQYAVCFGFVMLVFRVPLLPISGGFDVPLISDLYSRADWNGLRHLFRAFFEYIYIFVLPLAGGGILLGPDLVGKIYGPAYREATPILLTLLILLGLTKLLGVTGSFLLATDREGLMLGMRLSMAVVNVLAALAAIPRFGAVGAAIATGTTLLGLMIWEGLVVHRYLHPRFPWEFLARTGASTAVMMGVVWAARVTISPEPTRLSLLLLIALGTAAYVAMLLWLRPVSPDQAEILARGGVPLVPQLLTRIARPSLAETTGTIAHRHS